MKNKGKDLGINEFIVTHLKNYYKNNTNAFVSIHQLNVKKK